MNRGKLIGIGLSVITLIAIGGLSFSLIRMNSELVKTHGDLSLQQQTATTQQQILIAAAETQGRQFGLATEATRSDLSNQILVLNAKLNNIQSVAVCSFAPTKIDFTNNLTVSKDLVSFVGYSDGPNLKATWEVIWGNSQTSIHKIYGKYLWVYIVTFRDNRFFHDSVYDVQNNCYLYIKN
jgi:hypothetical protein